MERTAPRRARWFPRTSNTSAKSLAGLLSGMLICGTDQFVATDACAPVYRIFRAATRPRGVIGEALIDPNVIFCHAARGEALLETASHFAAIQRGHPHRSDAGLIDIVDDHAGHPFVDHLRDRSGAIGEDRRAARHRLDHHEAERLRP